MSGVGGDSSLGGMGSDSSLLVVWGVMRRAGAGIGFCDGRKFARSFGCCATRPYLLRKTGLGQCSQKAPNERANLNAARLSLNPIPTPALPSNYATLEEKPLGIEFSTSTDNQFAGTE